jgi:hypothetical protein
MARFARQNPDVFGDDTLELRFQRGGLGDDLEGLVLRQDLSPSDRFDPRAAGKL